MEQSDLDLVRAAGRGDNSAFHVLVDRHAGDLFRVACLWTRGRADAEDVLQESLAGAYTGLKRFDGRSSVKTWLTRIVMRQAARAWRKSKRSREAVPLEQATESQDSSARLTTASPSAAVDRRIDVMAVVERLAPEHREVILLREMQGLSYAEIAEMLAIPRGTVESRLHRARAELRQRLQGYLVS